MRSSLLHGLFAGAGVARSWRPRKGGRMLMTTMSSSSPWLMLPPGRGSSGGIIYNFYSLTEESHVSIRGGFELEDGTRFVGSSHGWLALFNDRRSSLFLTNPISGRRIDLPPIDTLPDPEINMTNGRWSVSKAVLQGSPDDDEDECRTVISYGPADRLAFCSPGRSTAWTPFGTRGQLYLQEWIDYDEYCPFPHHLEEAYVSYSDFVYSRRKKWFFCLSKWHCFCMADTQLEGWDLSNPEGPRNCLQEKVELEDWSDEQRYLVYSEKWDRLYLVRRHMRERVGPDGNFVKHIYYHNRRAWDNSYPYETVDFDVHVIDQNNGTIASSSSSSLDGVAMFVGINHGFAREAEFGVNGNSIYFTDYTKHAPVHHKWVDTVYGGHDIGIFDYNNKTFSPCFYPFSFKPIHPPPLWFTPHTT